MMTVELSKRFSPKMSGCGRVVRLWLFLLGVCPAAAIARGTEVQIPGVQEAQISLNGEWRLSVSPPEQFWLNQVSAETWPTIPVPGELHANGFKVEYDKPFVYKTRMVVPRDYAGQRVELHFEAVYNLARVWVNERPAGTHQGGFTPWSCDVTDLVTPGREATVTIEVTAVSREISFGGKAVRNIGGILRDVELRARPRTFLDGLRISTDFDSTWRDAKLRIAGDVSAPDPAARVRFRLFDPAGREVQPTARSFALATAEFAAEIDVQAPVKWDAEHPNLYRLQVEISNGQTAPVIYSKRIGFRTIAFDRQHDLLVNGRVVKLRGINRHLSDGLRGKVPTEHFDRLDAQLIKEANMNFVRTSHYPPGARFLEQCDEVGLYVTVESAVVDVGKSNRPSVGLNDDPQFEPLFLSQLREMIAAHGSHPSALIWSIGNESLFGRNFQASYDLVKRLDASRPVVASYQAVKDERHSSYDIESHHYPQWNAAFSAVERPMIYDEWMHVLGHGAEAWFHDPNGRDAWGRSLDLAWSKLFAAYGSIGAAIWQYVDDVVYMPTPRGEHTRGPTRFVSPEKLRIASPKPEGNVYGVARWGIVDEWRRKKPEFWNVQKAYSPIRVGVREVADIVPNRPISLPVHNRFDHTDLSEITMRIEYAGAKDEKRCEPLPPHAEGLIVLPGREWRAGTAVTLTFLDGKQRVIDIERIRLGASPPPPGNPPSGPTQLKVVSGESGIVVSSDKVRWTFNRASGLLESASIDGKTYAVRGPFPLLYQNLEYRKPGRGRASEFWAEPEHQKWKLTAIRTAEAGGRVVVTVTGRLDAVEVEYVLTFGGDGRCEVDYAYRSIPLLAVSEGPDAGVAPIMLERGVQFEVGDSFDELSWSRRGYWSWYPEGHQGALAGRVPLWSERKPVYRAPPGQPWEADVHDYFYQGVNVPAGRLLTNLVRGAKMNVDRYSLADTAAGTALTVVAAGDISCRFAQGRDRRYYLQVLNLLDYNLRWGNFSAGFLATPEQRGRAMLQFGSQPSD